MVYRVTIYHVKGAIFHRFEYRCARFWPTQGCALFESFKTTLMVSPAAYISCAGDLLSEYYLTTVSFPPVCRSSVHREGSRESYCC